MEDLIQEIKNGKRKDLQGARLRNADLQGADLKGARLRNADLQGANLRNADLRNADLRDASLQGASLWKADLQGADLKGARLRDASLQGARLRDASLQGASLRDASLQGANLRGADLRGAKDIDSLTAARLLVPPQEGSFIAFKKVVDSEGNQYVAKLLIPEEAERSSATGRKCRASKVITQCFFHLGGRKADLDEVLHHCQHGPNTLYKVGEVTLPDKWDPDRWNESSHGIHFFMPFEEAAAW